MILLLLAQAVDVCGAKTNQTAMTMCEGAAAQRADATLNAVWKQVYPAMQKADRDPDFGIKAEPGEPGYSAALLASQRAWLAYREAECTIERYEWRGGSMQPFAENQCRTAITEARTRKLREMLKWVGP